MPAKPERVIEPISLLQASWLSGMPVSVLEEAASIGKFRHYEDGAVVHARGAPCDGFYTIASGAVRFSRTTEDGKASSIAFLEAPNWFGEISVFDGKPRTHDGHAVGRTTLLFHPKTDFRRFLSRHPQIYERFLRMLSTRLRATFDMLEEAVTLPLSQRLARRLLELAQLRPSALSASVRRHARDVPLTQEELGHLLGMTRQSIAKQLRLWEQAGVLKTHYGRIAILDPQALAGAAFPERNPPRRFKP